MIKYKKLEDDLIILEDFADHYNIGDKIFLTEDLHIFYTIRAKSIRDIENKWYIVHLLDRKII